MKVTLLLAAVIAGLGAAVSPSLTVSAGSRGGGVDRAATRLAEERGGTVSRGPDPSRSRRFPADSLAPAWPQLLGETGPVGGSGPAAGPPLARLRAVDVPVRFEHVELVARVSYDDAGRVVGLVFRPAR